ncbi:hypothetical protein DIURU_000231 [Diutina rugosa]|uniref:carnosine N-methyltransferase n=1 Tax=Diutina rugosa TaxID=5481 RepID=A0A642UZ34_DIURU|nr:uncharacterized protein DIURU_000231 [Diutina rugosa]KAA8908262.1 hypothetical protein DIURU_000231 [Diutina rugosa]
MDAEEYAALTKVLSSYLNFGKWQTETVITPRRRKWQLLSPEDRRLLPWFERHLEDIRECIAINESFTKDVVEAIAAEWGVSSPEGWAVATTNEYDKVRSILLQLAREWSDQGAEERKVAFGMILDQLESLYPDIYSRQDVKVLVPGAGLGRLVFELVSRGFWTQGNEFSYHMLLMSNYLLNHCPYPHSASIFPFISKGSHVGKRLNMVRPVSIPDVSPSVLSEYYQKYEGKIPFGDLMSMTAGSFTDLYGPPSLTGSDGDEVATEFREQNHQAYDVVVTCFFLDTASNVIDYIRTIKHCLKPDGKWINFGPLLWHWEDVPEYSGLEMSRADLLELCQAMGFEFDVHKSDIETVYSTDPRALGKFVYNCEFWVASMRKEA